MMNNAPISLSNLSIGYKAKHDDIVVAKDISASLKRGKLTFLLGANGVGKSTLLRTLSAFQPSLQGQILLEEREIGSYSMMEIARLIGVVLTVHQELRHLTVQDVVNYGRTPYSGFWGGLNDEDKAIVSIAMQQTGITDLSQRQMMTLSDGERQKVMIAKALAQETPVILLDEPTAYLDYPSKVEMFQLLRNLAHEAGKAILVSTHDLELALQLADEVWLMENGEFFVGSVEELTIEGHLSRFINRKGITYNTQTKRISIV